MRVPLDTHVLLWVFLGSQRLIGETCAILSDPDHDVSFSAASIWEIAIKSRLGRVDFAVDPYEIAMEAKRVGFREITVDSDAAALVAKLPPYHRDPFDRLLVAQEISSARLLFTADEAMRPYSDLVTMLG
jgi:PIN domain nuclease of toxin-antitoxin system